MKNEFFLARQARAQLDAERARINSLCRTYGARFQFASLPTLPASPSHPNTRKPRAPPSHLAKTGQVGSPGVGGPGCSPSAWANLWSRLRRLDCGRIKNCAAERTHDDRAMSSKRRVFEYWDENPRMRRRSCWNDFCMHLGARFFFSAPQRLLAPVSPSRLPGEACSRAGSSASRLFVPRASTLASFVLDSLFEIA